MTNEDRAVIAELERLNRWVRRMEYNRDDAPDEIARAIENRIRYLQNGWRPCSIPGYEQRRNINGHLETRPISPPESVEPNS